MSSVVYKFQCNRCFIISGYLNRNPDEGPCCCGGEPMVAIPINQPKHAIAEPQKDKP